MCWTSRQGWTYFAGHHASEDRHHLADADLVGRKRRAFTRRLRMTPRLVQDRLQVLIPRQSSRQAR
jgi:hypothetical protein